MRILLAPMEGVVDARVRELLTAVGGIDLCVTEFVRVSQNVVAPVVFKRLSPELAQGAVTSAGTPVVVQLLGSDPELMAASAQVAVKMGATGIDLNFGCPAKTVNRSRGGSVLLDEPDVVHQVVAAVRRAVPESIPVSAKMRLGYRDKTLAHDNAQAIESAGADYLVVHARTKVEGYRPPAHWEWIAKIREGITIPVVANGDIWTPEDYRRCREVSGCADVMIGRGLLANPYLGREIKRMNGEQGFDDRPEGWPRPLRLVLEYLQALEESGVEAKHLPGRAKQWTNMLGWHFPEAKALFQEIKSMKEIEPIRNALKAAWKS